MIFWPAFSVSDVFRYRAPRKITRNARRRVGLGLSGIFAVAMLAGCSNGPNPAPVTLPVSGIGDLNAAVVSSETQTLSAAQLAQVLSANENAAYQLGPNDLIIVSVYEHPELSAPPGISTGNVGVLITSDGTIDMPLIGQVRLGGLTIAEAQSLITSDYSSLVKQPDVTIQIINPQSLRYYLLGAFTTPGVKYPGHAMTLLDALALGGSVDIANADLYQAYVAKGTVKLPIDLHGLLIDGDLSQNITLGSGDDIVIPPSTNEDAFVFGSVGKPGEVQFRSGELSLLQALSSAGLDLPNYTEAELSQIHLIRAHGASAELMVIDARKILQGTAANFALEPGDIVFVPPTGIASWNQVLDLLIPSLNTISGLLNPFVSIRYLSK
jgi:polysaccharide export outer membrane protein